MKSIAIIGAGIAGLRASLALCDSHRVVLWEKSRGLGGRVATRRFGENYVNHGAPAFDVRPELALEDELFADFGNFFPLRGRATDLPKEIFARTNGKVELRSGDKVLRVNESGFVTTEKGSEQFDHLLLTSPWPQTSELLGCPLNLLGITYSKKILFVSGEERLELDEEFSELCFDLSDEEIIRRAEEKSGKSLKDLELKKWRYSTVESGDPRPYFAYAPRITLAGDAFDPGGLYGVGAAWLSGLRAARYLQEL